MSNDSSGSNQNKTQEFRNVVRWIPRYFLQEPSVETRSSLEAIGIQILKVEDERYEVKTPDGWYWIPMGYHIYVYDEMNHLRIECIASPGGFRVHWMSD